MVICVERGANDCIADVTASFCHHIVSVSRFITLQNGLTSLVPAYPVCPGKKAIKQAFVVAQILHQQKMMEDVIFGPF